MSWVSALRAFIPAQPVRAGSEDCPLSHPFRVHAGLPNFVEGSSLQETLPLFSLTPGVLVRCGSASEEEKMGTGEACSL